MQGRNKKQTIIPPKEGWKRLSYYLVEVSFSDCNPVHHCIFYTGFLNDKTGRPEGYNYFADSEEILTISDVYYLRAIRLLVSEKEMGSECTIEMPDDILES